MTTMALFKDRVITFMSRENRMRLFELVRANIMLIDHNTFLGALWSFCAPVIIFIFMYAIFRNVFGNAIPHYPFYLFIGITCVNYFISQTGLAVYLLIVQKELIINSLTMRETVILASAVPYIYKFLIDIGVCVIIGLWIQTLSFFDLLLLLPLLASFIMATLGIGMVIMIGFNLLRDVAHVWGLVVRLLFFLTPVFYSLSDMHPTVAMLQYWLNPLTPFIGAFRDLFLTRGPFFWAVYGHCLLLGSMIFAGAYLIFLLLEHRIDECV